LRPDRARRRRKGATDEGHLVVGVPDQKSVITISSANHQEYPIDDEVLFPLVNELIMPVIDRS
jgi:hypothetical protein